MPPKQASNINGSIVNGMQRPGSSTVMTPTGYMTEDAWLEMAEETAAGIRAMPVICDNPDWWVVKIIDGFGPHMSSVEAMKIYAKHKVLLVKEEGDTSHVCQAYDQNVAFNKFICSRDESALGLACASESPFSGQTQARRFPR